jgi:AcrR family transcriptional regulator
MTSNQPGLRERKKLATRKAIGRAAIRLAVERGLDNVLVEDIAAAAGVSPRTFNNYFSSKAEAILSLSLDRAEAIGAELRERPADEPLLEAITHAVVRQHDVAEPPTPEWNAGVRLAVSALPLRGEFLKIREASQVSLAEGIAARIGATSERDAFCWGMAGAVVSIIDIALDQYLLASPPVALGPLIRRVFAEFTDGFHTMLPDSNRS